jgi:FtsP/CotA-like multicopper oxidase with cupredoxin domain
MKPNATKTIARANVNRAVPYRVLTTTSVVMCALLVSANSANAATLNQTLCVRAMNKTMSDGATVTFWGYTPSCGMGGVGQVPAMPIEVGIGDTLNLTLNMMMAIQEATPYNGHTIHLHGADVSYLEDGVPETNGGVVTGDTYTWIPGAEMAGTYMYHCHVHTVKHLEMGMYGPLIVRPINPNSTGPADRYLNQLTPDVATAYAYIQTYLLSTVDPAYHDVVAPANLPVVGDSKVFADYNPKYFLLNGKESINSTGAAIAAETLTVGQNKKVALRLIGLHSVNGTFSIRDGAGVAKPFTVYVEDGRQYPTAETVTSLDVGPGQRFDIIFTTPSTSGTWSPQFEYKKLRDGSPYATVFGRVDF